MPVIHSTTASQASQEMLRSTTRMKVEFGKALCSTRTVSRITASDSRIGTTSANTAIGNWPASSQRASSASSQVSNGNSTPSKIRVPNQIEPSAARGPRIRRTSAQPPSTQAATAASSSSAVGWSSPKTSWPRWSTVSGRAMSIPPGRAKVLTRALGGRRTK